MNILRRARSRSPERKARKSDMSVHGSGTAEDASVQTSPSRSNSGRGRSYSPEKGRFRIPGSSELPAITEAMDRRQAADYLANARERRLESGNALYQRQSSSDTTQNVTLHRANDEVSGPSINSLFTIVNLVCYCHLGIVN